MNILNVLGPAVTVVLFLGAAAVYLTGSRDKGTIATLERNNDALSKRVTILEVADAEKTSRIMALETENEWLKTIVTARDLIGNLEAELKKHRVELLAALNKISNQLDRNGRR